MFFGQEGEGPLTQTTIGWVVVLISVLIAVVYAFVNVRTGRKEIGSEVELAPNRKPYYDDEDLEGKRLDRTLLFGMITLMVVAISVPLYWLNEPGRQAGATDDFNRVFAERGADLFAATGENAQALNCAGCHGGMTATGGVAEYTITDAEGHFVRKVEWKAPALDTVLLRYNREEVRFILDYGRPFSPMPAWGTKGGGPLNDQQVQNLIDYMASIQITPEQAQAQAAGQLEKMMASRDEECVASRTRAALADAPEGAEAEVINENATEGQSAPGDTGAGETASPDSTAGAPEGTGTGTETGDAADPEAEKVEVDVTDCAPKWKTEGEALFNMGYDDGFAGGAYSCGRCHTQGWSYGDKEEDGGGAFGPNLTNGATTTQFPGVSLGFAQQVAFIRSGSDRGKLYGDHGQGSGRMPAFGTTPEEKADPASGEVGVKKTIPGEEGMLTTEMIESIVEYERSL